MDPLGIGGMDAQFSSYEPSFVPEVVVRPPIGQGKGHHVTVACDTCRAKKIKCNGVIPCQFCLDRGEECLVSERRKRGRVSKRDQMAMQDGSESTGREFKMVKSEVDVINNNNRTALLDVYFAKIAPFIGMTMISRMQVQQPANAAQNVQLKLILATSAMYEQKPDLAESLLAQARALAGEIFDEISVDSLLAFALLTEATLGRNPRKAAHYASIAMSISRDLVAQNAISDKSKPVHLAAVLGYVTGVTRTQAMYLPIAELERSSPEEFSATFSVTLGQCYMGVMMKLTQLVGKDGWYPNFDARWKRMYPGSEEYREILTNRTTNFDSMICEMRTRTNVADLDVVHYADSEQCCNETAFAELNGALVAINGALSRHAESVNAAMMDYWMFKLMGTSTLVNWKQGRTSQACVFMQDMVNLVARPSPKVEIAGFPACSPSFVASLLEFTYEMRRADWMEGMLDALRQLSTVYPVALKALPVFESLQEDTFGGGAINQNPAELSRDHSSSEVTCPRASSLGAGDANSSANDTECGLMMGDDEFEAEAAGMLVNKGEEGVEEDWDPAYFTDATAQLLAGHGLEELEGGQATFQSPEQYEFSSIAGTAGLTRALEENHFFQPL